MKNRNISEMNKQFIKWQVTGLLEGIKSEKEKRAVANMLEYVYNHLEGHEILCGILLPLTRRIYSISGTHTVDVISMTECYDECKEKLGMKPVSDLIVCIPLDIEMEAVSQAAELYVKKHKLYHSNT